MRQLHTDILVIGGGATGTGILRDLAMRGLNCILVERRDLAYGTTGRYHGLLHSGGRYVVKDPQTARECIEENKILRRIMPQCIEDTGGFFVLTAQDDAGYVPQFLQGCLNAGIPVDEIDIPQMLKEEPLLDPTIQRCFRLPDASADSFLAAELNAESARQYGAQVLTYHEVASLIFEQNMGVPRTTVRGAMCHDMVRDEILRIDASLVVNATGAWAGIIAGMAGISLQMLPGKGTMLALNHRVVNTVINRCKPPSDGDILVPTHTVAVIGTTDIRVTDPDHYSIEPWEIRLMLEEGEKIIPGFKGYRILRAWAGVRPLVQEANTNSDREISRAFTLLDHADRDGVEGMITITSGKWTTYRKMAEVTSDKVCEKLQINAPCRTQNEILPSMNEAYPAHHFLGARLKEVEEKVKYGQLVCECELATREDVEHAIIHSDAETIDDIRREVRLGMGPCQGAFCAFRAAGMLQELRHSPVETINVSLRDFLQERWKGDLPVLWGQQLRQERLNELIYIDVLNTPALPGERSSRLSTQAYAEPNNEGSPQINTNLSRVSYPLPPGGRQQSDVLIVGAGLAGLFAGWQASTAGFKTNIITKGWGATHWGSGCIGILGYQPNQYTSEVDNPTEIIAEMIKSQPEHPYGIAGLDAIAKAVEAFVKFSVESGYPYQGSLDKNYRIPTALGTLRPTCLVPPTMMAGSTDNRSPMLVIGFDNYLDFYPGWIVDNLNVQGIPAEAISLDLPSLHRQRFITSMVLARLFDQAEFLQEVVEAVKPRLGKMARIGFPAVLGLNRTMEVIRQFETALGVQVFEIPGLPPSIPGIRLQKMLVSAIEKQEGSVFTGMQVSAASLDGNVVKAVWSEAAARILDHPASNFILATGGILGGGIIVSEGGYAQDSVFGLNVAVPSDRRSWFQDEFLSQGSQPIHQSGIKLNPSFQPINNDGSLLYQNLYVAGSSIGNCDPIRERSLEGIALTTGFQVADVIARRG